MDGHGVLRGLWIVVLGAGPAAGCNLSTTMPEGDFGADRGAWSETDWAPVADLEVSGGRLEGRIGDVEADPAEEPLLQGYASEGLGASVQLHASTAAGALMTAVTVLPGFDHPSLAVGASLDGLGPSGASGDEGDLTVDVLGCSGPEEGQWDYDEVADDVAVAVTDVDGDQRPELTFTATFQRTTTGRPETVVSHFELGSTSAP